MLEPDYERASSLIDELAPATGDEDENLLDPDVAREIGDAVSQYALRGRHPLLLTRLLRVLEAPEGIAYEAAMAACSNDEDRALIWSELFLEPGAREAITGVSE